MFREGLSGRAADKWIGIGEHGADEIAPGPVPTGHRSQRLHEMHADNRRGIVGGPCERFAAEPAEPREPPDGERPAVGGMTSMGGSRVSGGGEHGLEQRGDPRLIAGLRQGPCEERIERQPPHGHVFIPHERYEPVVAEAGEVGG